MSSLTNLALSILVARQVAVEAFGVFSLIYASYLFALEFTRALVLEPLVISMAGQREEARRSAPAAMGATLCLAIIMAAVVAGVAALASGSLAQGLWILAAALPGLMLQDACRAVMLAYREPKSALINDATWGVALVAGAVLYGATSTTSVSGFLVIWAGTGAAAALLGCVQIAARPALRQAREWMRQTSNRGPYFLLDFLADSVALHFSVVLVGALAGLEAVGAFNAARVAVGPVGVLILAAAMVITSEGRRISTSRTRFNLFVSVVGLAMLTIGSTWGLILHFMPADAGVALLGDSFIAAQPVLLPMALYIGLRGLASACRVATRVIQPGPAAVILQICLALFTVLSVIVGTLATAEVGAAWGLVFIGTVAAAAWYLFFGNANRHRRTLVDEEGGQTIAER